MNICVYGASSPDIDTAYFEAGETLGRAMAKRGHALVFGAGDNGLMGAVARGVTAGKGRVIGIVPSFFNVDGILYDKCDELIRTETMRERKALMEARSDAFVMTPGGIGTFEEFFEILTLKQLARHTKAIAVLNTRGYFDHMLAMMDKAIADGFVTASVGDLYFVTEDPDQALDYLETYVPVEVAPSVYKKGVSDGTK